MNEGLIPYADAEIPLSLYAKAIKIDDHSLRYADMFPKLMIKHEEKIVSN